MRLSELVEGISGRILTHAEKAAAVEVDRVHASDKVSDLLSRASEGTLLVTSLSKAHLPRIADLVDAPALCLVNSATPDQELLSAALAHEIVLIVSPEGLSETCRNARRCLHRLARRGGRGKGGPFGGTQGRPEPSRRGGS